MTDENPTEEVQIETKTEELVQGQIESNEEMQSNEPQIESNPEEQVNAEQIEINQDERINTEQLEGEAQFEGEEKKEEVQREQIVDKMELGDSDKKDRVDIFEANAIIGSTTGQRYAQIDQNQYDPSQLNRPTKTLGLLNELNNQLTKESQEAQAMQAANQGEYQGYPAGFMSGYHGYQGGLINSMPGQEGIAQSKNLDDSIEKKIAQLKLKLSGNRNAPAFGMPGTQMAPEMQDMQAMASKQEVSPLGSYKRFNDLFSMINTESQAPRAQVNVQYANMMSPTGLSEYKPKQPKPLTGVLPPSSRFDIATPSTFSYKPQPMGYAAMFETRLSPNRNTRIEFAPQKTYSPRMYEIGNTESAFTKGKKELMPSRTANPAYMKFVKNYGAARPLHLITDQFVQKMKDNTTKANLNYLAENSGKRAMRTTGNYNRGFYTTSLSSFDTKLFPGGTNLRTRYKS